MDGKAWTKLQQYYPDILGKIIVRTTVFARFQPDQKTQLISHFQKLDYVVSMVGDGANDCGVSNNNTYLYTASCFSSLELTNRTLQRVTSR